MRKMIILLPLLFSNTLLFASWKVLVGDIGSVSPKNTIPLGVEAAKFMANGVPCILDAAGPGGDRKISCQLAPDAAVVTITCPPPECRSENPSKAESSMYFYKGKQGTWLTLIWEK